MWSRTSAFLIWAAAAAAAVFWVLRLSGASPQAPAHAQPAPVATLVRADLARVLGAEPVAAPAATAETPAPAADQGRFQLLGVIAPSGAGSPGFATLSVDGKPARTYRVGHVVEGSRVLQKVSARGVDIGPRGAAPAVSLQLSPLPPAATGRSAAAGAAGAAGAGGTPGAAGPVGAGGVNAGPAPTSVLAPTAAPGAAPEPAPESNVPAPVLRRPGVATR